MSRFTSTVPFHPAFGEYLAGVFNHRGIAAQHHVGLCGVKFDTSALFQLLILDTCGDAAVECVGGDFTADKRDIHELVRVCLLYACNGIGITQFIGHAYRVDQDHLFKTLPYLGHFCDG